MKGLCSTRGGIFISMLCEKKKDVVTWRLENNSVFFLGSRKPTRTSGEIGQARELEDSH